MFNKRSTSNDINTQIKFVLIVATVIQIVIIPMNQVLTMILYAASQRKQSQVVSCRSNNNQLESFYMLSWHNNEYFQHAHSVAIIYLH